jgi:hypothetical protein
MEPIEYCSIYVKSPQPHERGYRAACVRVLAAATMDFYSLSTIDKNWGAVFEKRPSPVLKLLDIAHTINVVHIALERIHPELTTILEQTSKVAPYMKHK